MIENLEHRNIKMKRKVGNVDQHGPWFKQILNEPGELYGEKATKISLARLGSIRFPEILDHAGSIVRE